MQQEREQETRQQAQIRLIREELGDTVEPVPADPPDGEPVEYFVRKGFVMVREQYAGRVREFLRTEELMEPEPEPDPEPEAGPTQERASGVAHRDGEDDDDEYDSELAEAEARDDRDFPQLGVPPRDGDLQHGLQWVRLRPGIGTVHALQRIREAFGHDVAFLEKYFHLSPDTGTCCPADEPTPVTLGSPPDPPLVDDRSAGAGVRIVVIDTGLYRRARRLLPWMRGVRGNRDAGIRQNTIAQYAGHGTFIAGVIRTVAPSADVIVRAGFQPEGVVSEKDLVAVLEWVLLHDAPDIINISGGTLADEDGPQLMFAFFDRRMRHHKGIALVVAAGNDGDRRHFWPAAAAWAVAVGALAANWRERAEFSNFGGWVDVFAPGEHIVNAFPSGRYRYNEPPRAPRVTTFAGMASWSGTSFSAPMVAGLIAARMSRTGENGTEAAAALLRTASRQALLGVGPVLLPTTDVCGKER